MNATTGGRHVATTVPPCGGRCRREPRGRRAGLAERRSSRRTVAGSVMTGPVTPAGDPRPPGSEEPPHGFAGVDPPVAEPSPVPCSTGPWPADRIEAASVTWARARYNLARERPIEPRSRLTVTTPPPETAVIGRPRVLSSRI